jgi:hypothetical protein
MIGKIAGLILIPHHALTWALEILYLQWANQVSLDRLEYRLPGRFLENRARDIKVPPSCRLAAPARIDSNFGPHKVLAKLDSYMRVTIN